MEVIKVGGSLLDWPELRPACERFLADRPGRAILVAGGGAAADLVRRWDRDLALSPADAHWLAIRAMSLTAELLARRLELPVATMFRYCLGDSGAVVLDLWAELCFKPTDIPQGWHVTSDSLAAWSATRLRAKKLVMLKSVGARSTTLAEALAHKWVDDYFPTAARGLEVEWVNLRDAR
jgi:aspartokinase-like uncharacterized kinase